MATLMDNCAHSGRLASAFYWLSKTVSCLLMLLAALEAAEAKDQSPTSLVTYGNEFDARADLMLPVRDTPGGLDYSVRFDAKHKIFGNVNVEAELSFDCYAKTYTITREKLYDADDPDHPLLVTLTPDNPAPERLPSTGKIAAVYLLACGK